jgi:hypothetical protein
MTAQTGRILEVGKLGLQSTLAHSSDLQQVTSSAESEGAANPIRYCRSLRCASNDTLVPKL